jgi:hypothetical protein
MSTTAATIAIIATTITTTGQLRHADPAGCPVGARRGRGGSTACAAAGIATAWAIGPDAPLPAVAVGWSGGNGALAAGRAER